MQCGGTTGSPRGAAQHGAQNTSAPFFLAGSAGLKHKQPMRGYLLTALAFAAVAALTRLALLTTKTRLQIAVLVMAALLFELFGRRRVGQRPRIAGFLLNAAVIALTMTAVKIAIEGPLHRPAWVRNLFRTIGLPPPSPAHPSNAPAANVAPRDTPAQSTSIFATLPTPISGDPSSGR